MRGCGKTPPRQNIGCPIPDVDLGNNTANDIAAWFVRQLLGVNGFSEEKTIAVLTHCAVVKELLL